MFERTSIAVVGAGVIGLACAFHLCRRGAEVTLYEADDAPGATSSLKAAGMLGAAFECAGDKEARLLAPLAHLALEAWGRLAEALPGGPDSIGYRSCGTLCTATSQTDISRLEALAASAAALGFANRMLPRGKALELAPHLSPHVKAALLLPEDGAVDPVRLVRSLAAGCREAGAVLRLRAPVEQVQVAADGVRIEGARYRTVVLASGAAENTVRFVDPAGDRLDPGLPAIEPVKGQMLVLSRPAEWTGDSVLRGPGAYIVPRGAANGSHLLVGATVEPGLRDMAVTGDGLEALRAAAIAMVPSLETARRVDAWAGVRPRMPDGRPLIGATRLPGVHAALGHYRNGILLAAATGELLAELLMDDRESPLLAPYAPQRFDIRAAASHSR